MITRKNRLKIRLFSDWILIAHALFFLMWWGVIALRPTLTVMAGQLNPVVVNTKLLAVEYKPEGAYATFEFYKRRGCEFEFLFWQDKFGFDHEIDFLTKREPLSRPTGGHRAAVWLIEGLKDIEGSKGVVKHDCFGLWSTYSPFYPSINMDVTAQKDMLPPIPPEKLNKVLPPIPVDFYKEYKWLKEPAVEIDPDGELE